MRDLLWRFDQGLVTAADIRAIDHRGTPIEEALEQWHDSIIARGSTARTARTAREHVQRLARDLRWVTISEIHHGPLERFLVDRRELSPRQRNRYRGAAKQFTRWLRRQGMLAVDPLADVAGETNASVVRAQRALTLEEVERLRSSVRWPDYLLLLRTGLRWSEASRLTWADVDLPAREIRVPQGAGKVQRQRASLLPIASDLAEVMEAAPGVAARPLLRTGRPPRPRTWARDLEAARIQRTTREGVATLGSWRATFCSHLAAAGVRADVIQRLRRDTSILLEAVYVQRSHVMPQLLAAVEQMVEWSRNRCATSTARMDADRRA